MRVCSFSFICLALRPFPSIYFYHLFLALYSRDLAKTVATAESNFPQVFPVCFNFISFLSAFLFLCCFRYRQYELASVSINLYL